MALVVKDRVRETSTTTGTGTITLAGAVTGYQSFSAIGDGNTTYYTIYLQGSNEWEVGIGTYTASGTTLSRDTILASSNGGSAVNFSAGTKDVFVTYPAGRSVWYDTATNVTIDALTVSNNTILGDASTDTVRVNGYMGVGGAGTANAAVYLTSTALTGTSQYGFYSTPRASSAATSQAAGFTALVRTEAAAFTLANAYGLSVENVTKGAGSTITNQHGVYISDQTQGTNNYGVTSAVSSGANKWNIYASGAAQNYFAGRIGIGVTAPVGLLDASGTVYSRFLNTTAPTLDNDTHAGEALYLRSGGTAGAENVQAVLAFGKADSSSQRSGAAIASIQTTADADQIGLAFYISSSTNSSQTMGERFRIGTTEAVFNDVSANYNFRVESDTNTHAIFLDAANSRVGINNSSPTVELDVTGALTISGNAILGDASTDTVRVNGYMGVGGAPAPSTALTVASTALTSTQQFGVSGQITGSSAATSLVAGVDAYPQTANASFTTTNVAGFYARAGLKGASNTASNWHGLYIADQTQGTNNYGITSLVSSGSNKWNIYASGTAANYFAGDVGIGATAPANRLEIVSAASSAQMTINGSDGQYVGLFGGTASNGPGVFFLNTAPALRFGTGTAKTLGTFAELMRLTSAGYLLVGTTTNTNTSTIVSNGTISETVSSTQYLVASQYDIGTAPNDIPLNQYLGSLAYQDASSIAGQVGLSAGTAALPSLVSATDTDTGMWFPAANTLAWSVSGAEAMRLNSSGNLGIGASSPTAKLDIVGSGDGEVRMRSGSDPALIFSETTANKNWKLKPSAGDFYWQYSATAYNSGYSALMQLTSSGNLGLGVTTSAWSGATALQVRTSSMWSTGGNNGLWSSNVFYNGANRTYIGANTATEYQQSGGQHLWYTAPSGFAYGTAATSLTSTQNGNSYTIVSAGTTDFTLLGAANNNVGTVFTKSGGTGTGTGTVSQNISFTQAMTLNASGNLGLGVPPSAWGRVGFEIGVVGAALTRDTRDLVLLSNAYWASGGLTYAANAAAGRFDVGVAGFKWYTASSGTAGNLITFTQVMTLDASGRLGVAATSPGSLNVDFDDLVVGDGVGARGITVYSGTASNATLAFADGTAGADAYRGFVQYEQNNNALVFGTDGTARARITSGGDFGVGTNSPSSKLHVYTDGAANYITTQSNGTDGSIQGIVFLGGANNRAIIRAVNESTNGGSLQFLTYSGGSGAERARITSGGYFKASDNGAYVSSTGAYHELRQTSGANEVLFVTNSAASITSGVGGMQIYYSGSAPNGTGAVFLYCVDNAALRASIRSNGGLANFQANDVNLSDQRTKKDIVAAPSYWDKIKGIEIVHFKYKDQTHDDNNVGVIAQQVEQVAPEFVDQDGWGETPEDGVPLKSIYTSDMYHAAIKALQEAMARIEKLEAEVAALKGA